jgi:DUF4097 and DUF4098 domain-containing protein YvlB
MRRRDVLLLILILLVGAGLQVGHRIRQGQLPLGIQVDGLEFLEGPPRTFSEIQEAPLPEGGRVEVESSRGDVEILTWDEARVRVEVRKQVRAESEKEAARMASSLRLHLTPAGEGLKAEVVPDPGVESAAGLRTDFTLTVPRKARLEVSTRYGSVEVHDLAGDVVIRAAHGDVDMGNIGGTCDITNRHGAVAVTGVTGNLKVVDEHDDVTVSRAEAAVDIDSSHGSVTVEDARGNVTIRNSRGEVRVEGAGGDVDVQARNSPTTLEQVSGNVTVSVEADPLEVSDVRGTVTVQADVTSVRLADVRGRIQVTGRHTDVALIRPQSDVDVQTTLQAIELSVPANHGFRVEATSDQGEIESDLPELHLPEEPASHFAGSLGDGHSRYKLSTSHSTIRIRKGSGPPKI